MMIMRRKYTTSEIKRYYKMLEEQAKKEGIRTKSEPHKVSKSKFSNK